MRQLTTHELALPGSAAVSAAEACCSTGLRATHGLDEASAIEAARSVSGISRAKRRGSASSGVKHTDGTAYEHETGVAWAVGVNSLREREGGDLP